MNRRGRFVMGASSRTQRWLRSNSRARSLSWRVGRLLYCASRGDNLGSDIAANGEEALQGLVAKHAAQRDTPWMVLDIGANRGEWTISMRKQARKQGAEGRLRIVSAEPVPETAALLRSNLERHGAGGHDVYQMAFSSAPGTAPMYIVGEGAGTNSLYAQSDGGTVAPPNVIMVPTVTVDEFLASLGPSKPAMIKIDVEGHDFDVLLGSRATLATGSVWCIQFEYNSRWISAGRNLRDVFTLAEEHDYLTGRILPEGLERIRHWGPELERYFECNYVLVHRSLSHWFIRSLEWDERNTLEARHA